jgi:sortase A
MSTVEDVRWSEVVEDRRPVATVSPHLGRGISEPSGERRAQVERLAGRFVENLISGAVETRRREHPSSPDPVVDWEALWSAGAKSSSVALAVGRVVAAAESLARAIAEGRSVPGSWWAGPGRESSPRPHALGTPSQGVAAVTAIGGTPSIWDQGAVAGQSAAPGGTVVAPVPVGAVSVAGPYFAPPQPSGDTRNSGLVSLEAPLPPVLPPEAALAPVLDAFTPRSSPGALRRERLATAFAWVRNAGIALILFAAWQLWGTSLAQHQAQLSLQQAFTAQVHQAPTKAAGPTLISADTRLREPAQGSVVARLQIPSIGVDQYVVEGTAEGDLQMGPGHYIGTAMPGQAGNVAIAGHRTTYGAPFNNLGSLVSGDTIDLTTDSGQTFEYVVSQSPVAVAPSDVKILNSFGDNRLTLTTCNPRYSATQRLVAVALLREPAGVATSPVGPASADTKRPVSGGGSVGWNMSYLPAVLVVLLFIVLLGLANRRAALYYGRRGRWLILIPIWVAAMYLLFGLLSSFVPATL